MVQAVIGKWGKSLALRLPADVAATAGLHNGERVDVETRGREIVIRHAAPRFTLTELFRGKSPQEWRKAYAGAFEWGSDAGREAVEE